MTLADAGIAVRRPGPGNHRAPCPKCERGDKDTALSVAMEPGGRWVAHCFRCEWKAAGIDGERPQARAKAPRPTRPAGGDFSPRWWAFWRACVDLRGSLGERYLQARACVIPPAQSHLRFHPAALHWPTESKAPALVALATDAESGEPRTLHLTYLTRDGAAKAALRPPRLLLPGHHKAGAVIRLWPDVDVERVLGIAEGIESALSLAHAGVPCWAAIDAGNLARLPALAGIEELVVGVDRDPAGEMASQLLARRWVRMGCRVRLVMPKAGDINDAAMGSYGNE